MGSSAEGGGLPSSWSHIRHRYERPRPVGQGGMGRVFLVWDRRLGRDVALKMILPEFWENNVARERFRREILAMASYPACNPNDIAQSLVESRRNRAITDILEPGSTFKIVAASAALESGTTRSREPVPWLGSTIIGR